MDDFVIANNISNNDVGGACLDQAMMLNYSGLDQNQLSFDQALAAGLAGTQNFTGRFDHQQFNVNGYDGDVDVTAAGQQWKYSCEQLQE